jgi:hypothetical protein
MELKTAYRQWNGDYLGLYGEYFSGSAEPVGITDLKPLPETTKYECKDCQRGAVIAPEHYGSE